MVLVVVVVGSPSLSLNVIVSRDELRTVEVRKPELDEVEGKIIDIEILPEPDGIEMADVEVIVVEGTETVV